MFPSREGTGRTSSPDIVAIAAHVLDELEAHQPRVPRAAHQGQPANTMHRPVSLEELTGLVESIAREMEYVQVLQQAIEERIATLEQHLRVLPAHIVRLDRRAAEAEAQLGLLDRPAGVGGVVVSSEVETVEQWLTVKEVAHYLNVSESTVRRYIRQGRVKAVRLPGGRQLRLFLSEVLAQLPQGRKDGAAPRSCLADSHRETQ